MAGYNKFMFKQKLVAFFLSVSLIMVLVTPSLVLAQADATTPPTSFTADMKTQLEAAGGAKGAGLGAPVDPRVVAVNIIRVALEFVGFIFFCLTLFAGFKWMTAGGNEEEVTKAKSLLRQAVIGLIIILSAYSITMLAARLALGQWTDYKNGIWIDMGPGVQCTGLSCP